MDNSAVRNKWMDREALENYRHAMRICCMNALHVCSDEALSELCYDLDISRNGDARAYEHLLGGQCMVITSEPGGGKSYLMWLLLRDYLEDCRDDSDRLPVFLDGRDCGIVWDSIEKGIVRALSGHFPLVTENWSGSDCVQAGLSCWWMQLMRSPRPAVFYFLSCIVWAMTQTIR